ncbi:MAG: phage portal protein [Lachnospiraceae bacterium]|nr:phage portal protein [Lachnospiraceae bacterium]
MEKEKKSVKRITIVNRGYSDSGASTMKRALKDFLPNSGNPIEDIDANNYTLRQRGRMLYMGSPIATSGLKTSRTNVIGVGLQLNPRIRRDVLNLSAEAAEEWEKKTKAEFEMWAGKKTACDAAGVNNFYEIQQTAFLSWLASGDVFGLFIYEDPTVLMPYSLRIRLIEADRCSTPFANNANALIYTEGVAENGNRIHDGVEVDKNGKVVAYHFCNKHPWQLDTEKTSWARVEATGKATGLPNLVHVMSTERPGQYRGVTILAQVVEPLLQIKRYTEAELMAAVVQSFLTGFIETTEDPSEIPFSEASGSEEYDAVRYNPDEYQMGPGQINVMNPGEKLSSIKPDHPNSGFNEFVKTVAELIGASLEIPRDLLLKEFNASYSASRAALLEAWKSFRTYRKWFTSDFCEPIYERWLSEAVARGRIQAPGFFSDPLIHAAWLGADWVGPSQGQLDPVKEITAEIMACENGFSTHEASTIRLNGGDWNANMSQLERENEKMQQILPSNTDVITNAVVAELREKGVQHEEEIDAV